MTDYSESSEEQINQESPSITDIDQVWLHTGFYV